MQKFLFGILFLTGLIWSQEAVCLSDEDLKANDGSIQGIARKHGLDTICTGFGMAVLDPNEDVLITYSEENAGGPSILEYKAVEGNEDYNLEDFKVVFDVNDRPGKIVNLGKFPRGTLIILRAKKPLGVGYWYSGDNNVVPFISDNFSLTLGPHSFLGGVIPEDIRKADKNGKIFQLNAGDVFVAHEDGSDLDFNDMALTVSNVGVVGKANTPKQLQPPSPDIKPGSYSCIPPKIHLEVASYIDGAKQSIGTGEEAIFYSIDGGETKQYDPAQGVLLPTNSSKVVVRAYTDAPDNENLLQSQPTELIYQLHNALPVPVATPGELNGTVEYTDSISVNLVVEGFPGASIAVLLSGDADTDPRDPQYATNLITIQSGESIKIGETTYLHTYAFDPNEEKRPSVNGTYHFQRLYTVTRAYYKDEDGDGKIDMVIMDIPDVGNQKPDGIILQRGGQQIQVTQIETGNQTDRLNAILPEPLVIPNTAQDSARLQGLGFFAGNFLVENHVLQAPLVDPAPQSFTEELNIRLFNPENQQADIFYSLDGQNFLAYNDPIAIEYSTVIHAVAVNGPDSSKIEQFAYRFLNKPYIGAIMDQDGDGFIDVVHLKFNKINALPDSMELRNENQAIMLYDFSLSGDTMIIADIPGDMPQADVQHLGTLFSPDFLDEAFILQKQFGPVITEAEYRYGTIDLETGETSPDTLLLVFSIPSKPSTEPDPFLLSDGSGQSYVPEFKHIQTEGDVHTYVVTQMPGDYSPEKDNTFIKISKGISSSNSLPQNQIQRDVPVKVIRTSGIAHLNLGPIAQISTSSGYEQSWNFISFNGNFSGELPSVTPQNGDENLKVEEIELCREKASCFEFLISGPGEFDLKVFSNLAQFLHGTTFQITKNEFESLAIHHIDGKPVPNLKRLILVWDGTTQTGTTAGTGSYVIQYKVRDPDLGIIVANQLNFGLMRN